MPWLPSAARWHGAILAALAVLATRCAPTTTECTEATCESEAIVTFPTNLVMGAYSLVLEGETEMATARCRDPSSPEAAENPEGLTCDETGFTLMGHPLANERELVVTVIPDEGEEVSEVVRLDAIEEITPNGPDCPPICVIRNGQLRSGVGT